MAYQFNSVQSLDRLGRLVGRGRGDMRDDSAEISFQFFFFLQEALVGSSGMGRDVLPSISGQHGDGGVYKPTTKLVSIQGRTKSPSILKLALQINNYTFAR